MLFHSTGINFLGYLADLLHFRSWQGNAVLNFLSDDINLFEHYIWNLLSFTELFHGYNCHYTLLFHYLILPTDEQNRDLKPLGGTKLYICLCVIRKPTCLSGMNLIDIFIIKYIHTAFIEYILSSVILYQPYDVTYFAENTKEYHWSWSHKMRVQYLILIIIC